MARKPMFTDDEIWYELRKLGFEEVPDELFETLKEELENITMSELTPSNSSKSESTNVSQSTSFTPESSSIIPKSLASCSYSTSAYGNLHEFNTTMSNEKPKFKTKSPSSNKENFSSQTCFSVESKMIKRKTLRHINGQTVITEGYRIVPSRKSEKSSWNNDVKITSCDLKSDESLSTSGQSRRSSSSSNTAKTKSSTIITSLDKLLSSKSSSTRSLSSKSSSATSSTKSSGILVQKSNTTLKKHDPVARYHEYKKYWDTFKPPNENKHLRLRWAIRDKLLDHFS